jgi:WD40 repeat protein
MKAHVSPKSLLRARFRLLAAVGLACLFPGGSAVGDLAASGATSPGDKYRIVLASDRDGVNRGYSVLADGSHLAPLLPRGRRLVPVAVSANGRTVAYMKVGIELDPTGAVYVSRGSGAGFRLIARRGYAPALSRDGRLLAFTSKNLWIAATDGRGRRRLGRCGLCATLDWAPGRKALVFDEWLVTDDESRFDIVVQPLHGKRRRLVRVHTDDVEGGFPSWSPNGRWIAYVDDGDDRPRGLWVVRPNGSRLHRVAAGYGFSYAWSPDGRRLAFVRSFIASGVSIVDVDGHEKRLRLGVAVAAVAWSPDGRELLLAARAGGDPRQIWAVGTDGRGLRRLTSGGSNTLLGTTRMPPVLPAAPPIPSSERVASGATVETSAPIADLSADGPRVAFIVGKTATDCHHAAVWTPGATSVERLALQAPCWYPWDAMIEVELAGSRAAWIAYNKGGGYPGGEYALTSATLAEPTPWTLSLRGLERGQVWDYHLRGHGDFLLFNDGSRLVRIGTGSERCDGGDVATNLCATLKRGAHAAAVDSVSGGLIAIREPDAVTVLDVQGNVVRLFPFAPGGADAARLDGGRLVVWRFGALEAYDVRTGALEVSRPAPAGYRLVDADGGVAVLVRDDTALLVRLGDGASRTFKPGGPIVAELEPTGLYYAHRVGNGGRLVFVPRSEVFS